MIDCHTHLDDERLICDIDQIVADFESDGLDFIIDASADFATMQKAFELSQKYDKIFATIGCHPNDALTFDQKMADLMAEYAKNPKVVAVGEIGLDYHYDEPGKDVQHKAFVEQLDLANSFGLPVQLHVRDAYGDALQVMKDNKSLLKNGVLLHCYSGSKEMAQEFLKFDAFFSFGGAITFKNAKKEEIIQSIPVEKLLTETDAPYMTPHPFRGTTNYPKLIKYTYLKMAEVLGMSFEQLEQQIKKNTFALFKRTNI